jgi:hypothetical protein
MEIDLEELDQALTEVVGSGSVSRGLSLYQFAPLRFKATVGSGSDIGINADSARWIQSRYGP